MINLNKLGEASILEEEGGLGEETEGLIKNTKGSLEKSLDGLNRIVKLSGKQLSVLLLSLGLITTSDAALYELADKPANLSLLVDTNTNKVTIQWQIYGLRDGMAITDSTYDYGIISLLDGSFQDFYYGNVIGAYTTNGLIQKASVSLSGFENAFSLAKITDGTPFIGWYYLNYRQSTGEDQFIQPMDTTFVEKTLQPSTVAEPSNLALIGAGLVGIGAARRRKKKREETEEV